MFQSYCRYLSGNLSRLILHLQKPNLVIIFRRELLHKKTRSAFSFIFGNGVDNNNNNNCMVSLRHATSQTMIKALATVWFGNYSHLSSKPPAHAIAHDMAKYYLMMLNLLQFL